MNRALSILALLVLGFESAAEPVFTLPVDYEIVKASGEGAVRFPMFGSLDDQRRLYVTESSGLDLYEELQKLTRRCRISRLTDGDRDGRYERAEVFATNLVFPMGVVWRDQKLYVADPPDLITLEDTDNDGKADKRTVLLTGFGHTDNGSLHGLTFGPDGWLYLTMGQPDGYRLETGGRILEGKSGALIRCRPDGTEAEVICRGFENLVEIVFMPGGEIIGTDNWFYLPQDGVRDALVHCVPGGLYPLQLQDKGTPFLVTGQALPALASFPAVALSGLARADRGQFSPAYHGAIFSAQFNTRKVGVHRLTRHGATFQSLDETFLSTEDEDFHPSDVLFDEDGSLLVIDTGSWYVHHCPTGRIRNTQASGGIYRIKGPANFRSGPTSRSAEESFAERLRVGSANKDKTLRATALRALTNSAAHLRTAAAEALAVVGEPRDATEILGALETAVDQFEEHAIINALHKTADLGFLRRALAEGTPRIKRVATMLLDQPPREALKAEDIQPLFGDLPTNSSILVSVFRKHPDWVESIAVPLSETLDRAPVDLIRQVALNPSVAREVTSALINRDPLTSARLCELAEIYKSHAQVSPALREQTARLLNSELAGNHRHGLKAARSLGLRHFSKDLRKLASNGSAGVRLAALSALAETRVALTEVDHQFVVEQIKQAEAAQRLAAFELLPRLSLDAAQFREFLEQSGRDPLLSPALLFAVATKSNLTAADWKIVTDELVSMARRGAPFAKEVIEGLVRRGDEKSVELIREALSKRESERSAQFASARTWLTGGDINRGHELFLGKAGCAACHRVGKTGGLVGPDLTKIGAIRSGSDLLESLILPSASFAQGYETFLVKVKDGEDFLAIKARQPDDSLVFRNAAGVEFKPQAGEILSVEKRELSIMPEGLATGLLETEARDLMAYLQSLK